MRSVRAELLPSTGWFGSVHASEFEAELTRRASVRLSGGGESRGEGKKASPLRVVAAAMPSSVGMRRTTRVFGVVKGADGARVLRSGRRLWPDSAEAKTRRQSDGDDWLKVVKSGAGGGKGETGGGLLGWASSGKPAPAKVEAEKLPEKDRLRDERLFGIVYSRKRKRSAAAVTSPGDRSAQRQKRKLNSGEGFEPGKVVSIVAGSALARNYCLARFLCLVLVYMTRARLRLADLFAFLASEPISGVNSSSGMSLFLDHPLTRRFASCQIFGAVHFVPLFSVDFSAIPLCFMNMHACMFLRFKNPLSLRNKATDSGDEPDDEELEQRVITSSDANSVENKWLSNPSLRASKLLGRSIQHNNGLISRGIQKRRSSLRRKRARNPLPSSVQKPNNGLVSDLVSFRKNAVSFSVTSNNKVRRSVWSSSPVRNMREASSRTSGSAQSKDSTICRVNMLVIESDKCHLEEGAQVVLDMSPSGEWVIAVKKDGSTKFTHKAEKVLKPYNFNRFTHSIVWTGDNGWKLEFHDKKDWTIFKDLYKKCLDRNMPAPGVKAIPIPGVNEVSQNGNSYSEPFCRPDSYITVKDDEVCRAMVRKSANYDLDSEDELWLKQFNSESSAKNDSHVHLLEDTLELMVDVFEKAYYCSPYDLSEEKPPADLGSHLGSREVIEDVYSYWMEKRKLKQSSLLRIFQSHQLKRASLVLKPLFRKKRSFKRQPSKVGRVKLPSLLQVIKSERDTAEEQNTRLKVDAAKSSSKVCMELAVHKRRKAQLLMKNADLATYKATVALRIADGAVVSESSAVAADHFLD